MDPDLVTNLRCHKAEFDQHVRTWLEQHGVAAEEIADLADRPVLRPKDAASKHSSVKSLGSKRSSVKTMGSKRSSVKPRDRSIRVRNWRDLEVLVFPQPQKGHSF